MKKFSVLAITVILCLCLVGCSNENVPCYNAVCIVTVANNEHKVNTNADVFYDILSTSGSSYTFINAEGSPHLVYSGETIDLKGYSKNTIKSKVERELANLSKTLHEYKPVSPEKNISEAIELATRVLNTNSQSGTEDILIICGSGLSTAGVINFSEVPICKLDIDTSVNSVISKIDCDLSGVNVIFYGIGDVCGNQGELSSNEAKIIRDFYEKVLLGCGAESVTFKSDLPLSEEYNFDDLPVSVVPTEGSSSALSCKVASEVEDISEIINSISDSPIILTEKILNFIPNSAEFINEDDAIKAFEPIRKYIEDNPEADIIVYASCAGENYSESYKSLARARAEAVKAILGDVTIIDVTPSEDPFYEFGLGLGEEAAINRKVVIFSADSDFAKNFV